MTRKPELTRRRIGRPPAGAREGERVKDYPQMSVRLPPEVKARVEAMSVVCAQPQWRIISEAVQCFFRDLPTRDRRSVDGILQAVRAAAARGPRSQS